MGRNRTPESWRRGILVSQEALEEARRDPYSMEVMGEEDVLCLECGRRLKVIGASHLSRIHGMSAEDYREAWGYSPNQPLEGRYLKPVRRAQAIRLDLWNLGERVDFSLPENRVKREYKVRPQSRRFMAESHRRSPRPHPTGSGSVNYRSEITMEQIQEVFGRTGKLSAVQRELNCTAKLISLRLREAGLTRQDLKRVRPAAASLSEDQEALVRCLVDGIAASGFDRPEHFRPAIAELLRDTTSGRCLRVIGGKWIRPVHSKGRVFFGPLSFSSRLPKGGRCEAELRDGLLELRGEGASLSFEVDPAGFRFEILPEIMAVSSTGVGRLQLDARGDANLSNQRVQFERGLGGAWIYWIFSGMHWLFVDEMGRPMSVRSAPPNLESSPRDAPL